MRPNYMLSSRHLQKYCGRNTFYLDNCEISFFSTFPSHVVKLLAAREYNVCSYFLPRYFLFGLDFSVACRGTASSSPKGRMQRLFIRLRKSSRAHISDWSAEVSLCLFAKPRTVLKSS
jgi:hypothetical protein